jgi:hypothetical protein
LEFVLSQFGQCGLVADPGEIRVGLPVGELPPDGFAGGGRVALDDLRPRLQVVLEPVERLLPPAGPARGVERGLVLPLTGKQAPTIPGANIAPFGVGFSESHSGRDET